MSSIYKSARRRKVCIERQYLIEARMESGKTQQMVVNEIAKKHGVILDRSTLGHWESGDRKPDAEVLAMLCDVYGLSLQDVVVQEIAHLRRAAATA